MVLKFLKFINGLDPEIELPPRLKISDQFADVPLRNQYGQRLRFKRDLIEKRALVINTMYTVCKGSCPGTSLILENLRDSLTPIFGNSLAFVSITLDPLNDTPAALLEYAANYGADRPRPDACDWQFVTGSPANIDRLRRSLGFYDLNPRIDQDLSQHGSLLYFGNARTDRWAAMPAPIREPLLIDGIRRACGATFEQRYGIKG